MRQTRKLSDLHGYALQARDGEIGTLREIYFDDEQWRTRYFVIRTGGWLFGREVLIPPSAVTGLDAEHQHIEVDLTRQQIKDSPPVGAEHPVSRHYEQEYYRYYQYQPYWESSALVMPTSAPAILNPADEGFPPPPPRPHLRSSDEITGYAILARNGEMGNVKDFLLDDVNWRVRYLMVHIDSLLTGKKVLVSPAWITEVNWPMKTIGTDLEMDAIRTAPAYDPDQVLSMQEEIRIYAHYGKSIKMEEEAA